MIWKISDGTEVELNSGFAFIRGSGPTAVTLRADAARVADGMHPLVSVRPPPGDLEPLDFKDPWIVDRWIHHHMWRAGTSLVSHPEIKPPKPTKGTDEPFAIY